jgi:hypothetical protein
MNTGLPHKSAMHPAQLDILLYVGADSPRVVGVSSGSFEQHRALLDVQFNNTTVKLMNAK